MQKKLLFLHVKIMIKYISLLLLFPFLNTYAQVSIGTTDPDDSAIVEIKSNSRGFLPPRLNSIQRNNIENPSEGLTIFNTTSNCIQFYNGSDWFDPCCAEQVGLSFNFGSAHFVFDPVNESSFVKMNVTNGTADPTPPVNNDFIHSLKDDVNNQTLDYEAGSVDVTGIHGHAIYQYKDSASSLAYKSNRFISRVTETSGGGLSSVSNLRYLYSPPLQESIEVFFIARIDPSSFNFPNGAIFHSHKQGQNGHYTFGVQSGASGASNCSSEYYTLRYSTPTSGGGVNICGNGSNRVKTNDGKFHLFHVKSEDDPNGSSQKLLSFSIDGVLLESVLINNYVKFNAVKVFTNQTANTSVKADIKFLSLSPILSASEAENLLEYLTCKYLD